jgi:DNA-binding transcriptional LysR family regulator
MIKFNVIHWLLSGIKGRLIELLPVHVSMRIGIYTVFLSRKFLAPKAKVFVDFLLDQFKLVEI